ncbi:hypothetical protein HDU79_009075 [Rhizoclosmatium sp. JEL0117]|nr:hypothetical protein HDU79_009075 [Rhizoclosmatium sp. JEL0117]
MVLYNSNCTTPGAVYYTPSMAMCTVSSSLPCLKMTSGVTTYGCVTPAIKNYTSQGPLQLQTTSFVQISQFSPTDSTCSTDSWTGTQQYVEGQCFTFTNLNSAALAERFQSAKVVRDSFGKKGGYFAMKMYSDQECGTVVGKEYLAGKTIGGCYKSNVTGTYVKLDWYTGVMLTKV